MGLCIRVLVLIFLVIFTACAVCSSLFPQFRVKKEYSGAYMRLVSLGELQVAATNVTIDYWSIKGHTPTGFTDAADLIGELGQLDLNGSASTYPERLLTPTRNAFADCPELKNYFIASGALAIAGAAFGGLATLLAAGHIPTTANCCLACSILLFCLVAFACMAVSFALMVRVHLKDTCDYLKFSKSTNLVEGFGLSVAACGGFLITAFFELCA